jgi:diphthine synthase
MTLYLIGLGLNQQGVSKEGLDAISKCKKLYLENYTVDFPYNETELEEEIGKKFVSVGRDFVEEMEIIDDAKKMNVGLMVYGSPLTATTHISLIQEAIASGVKYKIIYGPSVLDAVAQTGLQLYKFGKVASMPAWKKSYEPSSFMEIVSQNRSIGAHSLILVDIGLDFLDALKQLKIASKEQNVKLDKIILCQSLGTKHSKIFYGDLDYFYSFDVVKKPYCIIIPDKLHFVEEDVLKNYEER